MTDAVIYTDGSCAGNPGPGGWAAIVAWKHTSEEIELSGGDPSTTNNRMELMAAIAGLEHLKERLSVKVVTDSQYVQLGITQWIYGWKLRNWRTAGGKPVLNQDLWERLVAAEASHHFVDWEWVKAHNGHPFNERADALAKAASMTAFT